MSALLQIRDLRITARIFPVDEPPREIEIVKGVSLDLQKGRVLGLIGESGAGKSTIGLAALAHGRGGVRISGGQVLLDGQDILALGSQNVAICAGAGFATSRNRRRRPSTRRAD